MSEDSFKSQSTIVGDGSQAKTKDKTIKLNFGGPIRVVATLILAVLLSQFAALLFVASILAIVGSSFSVSDILENSAIKQFAYILFVQFLAVGIIYLYLRRRKLSLKDIGFSRWPIWKDIGFAILGFVSYYAILIIATLSLSLLIPSFDVNQAQDVGFDSLRTDTDRLFAFLALVILAPLGEEILMRGYLYTGLRSKLRFLPSLLITSLIFGLAHLEFGNEASPVWVAGMATFVLSVVLIYVREKSKALYSPIAIHGMNNFVAFTIHFM